MSALRSFLGQHKGFSGKLRKWCCFCAEADDDELEQFLLSSAPIPQQHRKNSTIVPTKTQQDDNDDDNNDDKNPSGESAAAQSTSAALRQRSNSKRRARSQNVRNSNSNNIDDNDDDDENNNNNSSSPTSVNKKPTALTPGGRRLPPVWKSMNVVEDDQPLATLKMSGNMTLLISKLRMLLTLFVPEAENVFCQYQPSDNASQLVLALEYFIFLQDTLLSPIERLEVIHRALPTSISTADGVAVGGGGNSSSSSSGRVNAAIVRACKRCALEVANTESSIEELRKPGELFCIRKILAPTLDIRCVSEDPQITPQSVRMETEHRVKLSEVWRDKEEEKRIEEEKQRIEREKREAAEKLKRDQEERRKRKLQREKKKEQEKNKSYQNSGKNNAVFDDDSADDSGRSDVDEDDDTNVMSSFRDDTTTSPFASSSNNNNNNDSPSSVKNKKSSNPSSSPSKKNANSKLLTINSPITIADDAEDLLKSVFGSLEDDDDEKEEREIERNLIMRRDEKIISRIGSYPAIVSRFTDICKQRAADALRAASGAEAPVVPGISDSFLGAHSGARGGAQGGVDGLLGESGAVVGGGAAGLTAGKYERTKAEKEELKKSEMEERLKKTNAAGKNNKNNKNGSSKDGNNSDISKNGKSKNKDSSNNTGGLKNRIAVRSGASASLLASANSASSNSNRNGGGGDNSNNTNSSNNSLINNGSSRPYSNMPLSMFRCPKMSLLSFMHAWLTLDTDCSAVLSEKAVLHVLHLLGIFVTLTHIRDLVASISGSPVPIWNYDISTALILYEELSNIYSLPIFVPAVNVAMDDESSSSNSKNNNNKNNNNKGPKLSDEERLRQMMNEEPVHDVKDIKKFFKDMQYESKQRLALLFSHMGHAQEAEIDSIEFVEEVITNNNNNKSDKKTNNSKKIRAGNAAFGKILDEENDDDHDNNKTSSASRSTSAQQQQQQQQKPETRLVPKLKTDRLVYFIPRQLQLILRDNRLNSWFAEESQQIDTKAMAEMTLADFFICSSNKTYLAGPQFGASRSVSPEMIAHCLLREACRCIEIDVWEGRKSEPVVTNGGMTASSCPLADILMVVQRCAFARTSYPLIISLGVYGGFEFQNKLAQLLKDYFGRHILRATKVEKYLERNKPLTMESLKGKIILTANVSLSHLNNNNATTSKKKRNSSSSSSSTQQQQQLDGAKAFTPSLLCLLAAHRVFSHSSWRESKENSSSMTIWNDVEDPSHSTTAELMRKRVNNNNIHNNAGSFSSVVSGGGGGYHHHHGGNNNNNNATFIDRSISTHQYTAPGSVWDAPKRGTELPLKTKKPRGYYAAKRANETEEEQRQRKWRKKMKAEAANNSSFDSSKKGSSNSGFRNSNSNNNSNMNAAAALLPSSSDEDEIDSEDEFQALDPLYSKGAETMLHRITPNTARIDSSNLEPVRYWLSGTNIAALNFQVINDSGLRMNRDLFLSSNGGTGFIPKPFVLWRRNAQYIQDELLSTPGDNNNKQHEKLMRDYRPPALPKCNLRIEVLAASMLPPPLESSFSAGSGFSILIQLVVHETKTSSTTTSSSRSNSASLAAVAGSNLNDSSAVVVLPRSFPPTVVTHRYRTSLVQDNLHSPSWDGEVFDLDIDHPNSAILTVQALAVRQEEDLATPLLVGERSIFVHQLQQGVRMVPLVGQDGIRIDHPNSGILCRFSLTPERAAAERLFSFSNANLNLYNSNISANNNNSHSSYFYNNHNPNNNNQEPVHYHEDNASFTFLNPPKGLNLKPTGTENNSNNNRNHANNNNDDDDDNDPDMFFGRRQTLSSSEQSNGFNRQWSDGSLLGANNNSNNNDDNPNTQNLTVADISQQRRQSTNVFNPDMI